MFESGDKSSPPGPCLLGLLAGHWGRSRPCRSSGCTIVCASYGAQVLAGGRRYTEVPRAGKFSISINGTAHPSVFFSMSCSSVPSFTKFWSPYHIWESALIPSLPFRSLALPGCGLIFYLVSCPHPPPCVFIHQPGSPWSDPLPH